MLHPAHGDQVVEAFEEPVADTIFGNPVRPGIVADRNLGDGEAVHDGQGRKKTMHAGKKLQLVHHGAPENFQRAAGIVHPVAGHGAAHGISNARGELSDEIVVAGGAPAAHQIELPRQRQHLLDVGGIVLKVAVEGNDQVAGGMFEPGVEGGGLPVVPVEVQDADSRIGLLQLIQQFAAAVAAAVIDIHELERRCVGFLACRQYGDHPFGQ